MAQAFEQLRRPERLHRHQFSGRTDRYIFQERRLDNPSGGCEEHLDGVHESVLRALPDSMHASARGISCPVFRDCSMPSREEWRAPGRPQATLLRRRASTGFYGIDSYFSGGGFGEVSLERADVVRAAIAAVADGAARRKGDVLVIGDTPHDITSALDNGVLAVGVATGTIRVDLRR